jgi:dTDP-4-dehydrorhamnose reductase
MEQLFLFSFILSLRGFMSIENESIENRKTILILGINSFVGSNLAEFLKKDFRVVGTYFQRNIPQQGILTLPCNVLNKEEVQLVMYAFKPDIVLYCVGLTSLRACFESPNLCDALNSAGLYNVTELAPRYGARVVFFSSHYVFSGENKNYSEMDNPDVSTHYGKALASSEFYLQKSSLNYLIFRCCKMYGRGISSLKNPFFEALQKNFKNNSTVIYDDTVKQGFLDVYYLAMVLKMCIDKNISNRLLHFSSQDVITYFDYAKLYCEVFGESEGLVSKGKWSVPALKGAPYAENPNFKLDVLNMEGVLKIKMPTVKESLEFTYARFHGEKRTVKTSSLKGDGISFI